jgi:uncharacterized protein YeeX (DUF496 family)
MNRQEKYTRKYFKKLINNVQNTERILKLNHKKRKHNFKNWTNDLKKHFTKERIQIIIKIMNSHYENVTKP